MGSKIIEANIRIVYESAYTLSSGCYYFLLKAELTAAIFELLSKIRSK